MKNDIVYTDNSACRMCGNCRFFTTALRTAQGKPCCVRGHAALEVKPTAPACERFERKENAL